MTTTLNLNQILMMLAGALAVSNATAEDRIMFSTGDVQIRNAAGELRPAAKGVEIRPGDTIVTSSGGYVQARMQAGFMAVRPDSQVRLDAPLPSLNPAVNTGNQITLQQGAVRMIAAKQDGVPPTGAKPVLPEITIVTPNANISLSNADGEAVIAPPKAAGAVSTTISVVNSGAASVQGAIGAPVQILANQGTTVAGQAAPTVVAIAALPVMPAVLPKTAAILPAGSVSIAASPIAATATPAVLSAAASPSAAPASPISAALSGAALTSPTLGAGNVTAVAPTPATTIAKPPTIAPLIAVATPPPVIAPLPPATVIAPIVSPVVAPLPAPVAAPVISPVITPVITPPPPVIAPVVAPVISPVITPVITPPPPVITPVVSPVIKPIISPVIKPTLVCTTMLINGIKQQVCK